MNKINVLILKNDDNGNLTFEEKMIDDELDVYYDIIGCNTIDIISRRFGNIDFDFVIDDEFLLKDRPTIPTLEYKESWKEALFGTIIIAGKTEDGNKDGELHGLTHKDVLFIKDYIATKGRIYSV